MLFHVGFHARLSLDVRRPSRVDSDGLRGLPIGNRASQKEVSERNLLIGNRRFNWSLWHRRLLKSTFIRFYRRNEAFQQLCRRFLVP
jgi:hypothetical protein